MTSSEWRIMHRSHCCARALIIYWEYGPEAGPLHQRKMFTQNYVSHFSLNRGVCFMDCFKHFVWSRTWGGSNITSQIYVQTRTTETKEHTLNACRLRTVQCHLFCFRSLQKRGIRTAGKCWNTPQNLCWSVRVNNSGTEYSQGVLFASCYTKLFIYITAPLKTLNRDALFKSFPVLLPELLSSQILFQEVKIWITAMSKICSAKRLSLLISA